jgi:hypothetical protein
MGVNNIYIAHIKGDEERLILQTNYHQSKTMSIILKHPERDRERKSSKQFKD